MPRAHPMLFVLLGLFAVLSALIFAPFWAYAVGGLLLGYVGLPIYRWLKQRTKRDALSATLALVAIIVVIMVPLALVGLQLTLQAQALASSISGDEASGAIARIATTTNEQFGWPPTTGNQTAAEAMAQEVAPQVRDALLAWLPSVASYMAELLVGMTVALFIGYYTIRDGPKLVDWVEEVMPLRPQTEKRLIEEGAETLEAVILGQLATSAVIGFVGGIGLFITGVPAPVVWGFAMAVLSLIPVVGATIIWAPAAAYLFALGATWQGIVLILWGAFVVSSVDNIVKPMVIGKRSGMHPAIALLAAIGGLVAFGFMGFVIGPLVVAIFLILVNDYVEQRDLEAFRRHDTDLTGPPEGPDEEVGPESGAGT